MPLTCREVVVLCGEHLEGTLAEADRRFFDEHLAGCADCRTYLAQLGLTIQAAARLPAPSASPDVMASLLREFERRAPSPAAAVSTTPWSSLAPAATLVGFSLGLGLAREHDELGWVWLWGTLAAVVAALVAAAPLRRRWTGALGLLGISVVATLVTSHLPGLEIAVGARCSAFELMVAAAPLAVSVWTAWRAARPWRAEVVTIAMAGAMAGYGALAITCPVRDSLWHVLVFHNGTMLVTAGLSLLVAQLVRRRHAEI